MLTYFFLSFAFATIRKICVSDSFVGVTCPDNEYIQSTPSDLKIFKNLDENVIVFFPTSVSETIDIGVFSGCSVNFSGPETKAKIFFKWPTTGTVRFPLIEFKNLIVSYDVIEATSLNLINTELTYSSENRLKINGKFAADDDSVIGAYIECDEFEVTIGKTRSKNVTKVISTKFTLKGQENLTLRQSGNIVTIVDDDGDRRNFMLLGSGSSRTTTFVVESSIVSFSSVFSNAECAFQDVILPRATTINVLSSYWHGKEHIKAESSALISIFSDNFSGSFELSGDAKIDGYGEITLAAIDETSSIELVSSKISLKLGFELEKELTVTGEGSVVLPSVIREGGKLTCVNLIGSSATVYLPSSVIENPIISAKGAVQGTCKLLFIGQIAVGTHKILEYVGSAPYVVFAIDEKNSQEAFQYNTADISSVKCLKVDGVFTFPIAIEDIDKLTTLHLNYAEIELTDNATLDKTFSNKPVLLFKATKSGITLTIKDNSASSVSMFIVHNDIKLSSKSALNSVYYPKTTINDFSALNTKAIVLDNEESFYFGMYQKVSFNAVTKDITIRNASEVSFSSDTYDSMTVRIDVLKNISISGKYNNPNVTFVFTSTESAGSEVPVLTFSDALVGSIEFKNPVIIASSQFKLDVKGILRGSLLFDINQMGVISSDDYLTELDDIETDEAYVYAPSVEVDHPMTISSLALADSVQMLPNGHLQVGKMAFARKSTMFNIKADYHAIPFVRINKYEPFDESFIAKLFGSSSTQKLVLAEVHNMTGNDVFDTVEDIPFVCFDEGFDCSIVPTYIVVDEKSNVHLSCNETGRRSEKCLFLRKGTIIKEREYYLPPFETVPLIVLELAAAAYIIYICYFVINNCLLTYFNYYMWCNRPWCRSPFCPNPCCDNICCNDACFDYYCRCCACCGNNVYCEPYHCYECCDVCCEKQYSELHQTCSKLYEKCNCCGFDCRSTQSCCVDWVFCCYIDTIDDIIPAIQRIGENSAMLDVDLNENTGEKERSIDNVRYRSILYKNLKRDITRTERFMSLGLELTSHTEWTKIEPKTTNSDSAQSNRAHDFTFKSVAEKVKKIKKEIENSVNHGAESQHQNFLMKYDNEQNNQADSKKDDKQNDVKKSQTENHQKYPFVEQDIQKQKNFLESCFKRIKDGLDFMVSNNYSVNLLIPLCYDYIKVFSKKKYFEEKNNTPIEKQNPIKNSFEIMPIDNFDEHCLAEYYWHISKSENDDKKVYDYFALNENEDRMSLFERRIICQIMLSKKHTMPLSVSSLFEYNSAFSNWDYGKEVEFTRTLICPFTMRPAVIDPYTGKFISSSQTQKSNRINIHQYFIDYINSLPKENNDHLMEEYVHSRDELLIYLRDVIIPNLSPTLPRGILEIVDMGIADYERVPHIGKMTVEHFKELTDQSLHAFFTFDMETKFKAFAAARIGVNLYPYYISLYKKIKENPEILDVIIYISFDAVKVDKKYAEVPSNYLPIIKLEKEAAAYQREELYEILNRRPKRGSNEDFLEIKNNKKICDWAPEFNELNYFDKKVVALSLLTGDFIQPNQFLDPSMYQLKIENEFNDNKEITNRFTKSEGLFNPLYHGTNPVYDYVSLRNKLPQGSEKKDVDQLIGFYFNHYVPNTKLFLPYTIKPVLQSALIGAKEGSAGIDAIILTKKTQPDDKKANKCIKEYYNPNIKVSNDTNNNNTDKQRYISDKNEYNIWDIKITKDDISSVDVKDKNGITKIIKLAREEFNFGDQESFFSYKLAFNTIDIYCPDAQKDSGNKKSYSCILSLPIAGPVHAISFKQEKKIHEKRAENWSEDEARNKVRLSKYKEIITGRSLYELKIIILAVNIFRKMAPIDIINIVNRSLKINENTYKIPNFKICPATLYPYMTDEETWTDLPKLPEDDYKGFPVLKYLFDYIKNKNSMALESKTDEQNVEMQEDDTREFLPKTDELIVYIFRTNNKRYEKSVNIEEFALMPPNVKEICKSVIDSYKYVLENVLNNMITMKQFLLRISVCGDLKVRSSFERRYLRKANRENRKMKAVPIINTQGAAPPPTSPA